MGIKALEEVPTEMLPIKLYIEETISELAKQGIDELGQHGGYLNLNTLTSNPVQHTSGNALEFVTNFKIPYWYYMESDNDCTNCQFGSEMPQLCKTGRNCLTSGDNSIELQLEEYIKQKLPTKLDLNIFQSQGYEITIENLQDVEVTIRDKDIIFYIEYPIKVKRGQTFTVKQFQVIEESDLTELYEIALDMTNYHSNNCMIEGHVIKELGEDQGLAPNQLPPISETTIGPGPTRIWSIPEVKVQMKQRISDAMQVIGIFNNSGFIWPIYDNPTDPNADYKQALLDQRVFFPLKRYHDANIRLEYNPRWNPYVDITPNQGGALLPTEFGGGGGPSAVFTRLVNSRTYNFDYQYSFPTVVEIRKDDRNKNEQLFRIALEANIRGNRCFQSGMNIVHSTSLFPSLLCTEAERTEPLTIDVSDDFTLNAIQGAEVSYEIGNERCPLGRTDQNGILTTTYPDQNDGMIVINKEDYQTKVLFEPDISTTTSTKIVPIQEKNVQFKMIDANTVRQLKVSTGPGQAADILSRNIKPPTAEDTIMLRVRRLQETPLDIEFDKVVNFINGEIQPETLSLIPGTYNISAQVFIEKEITLPEEHDRYCIETPLSLGKCEKTPVSPNCHDTDFETTTNPECYTQGYTCEGNALGKACESEETFDLEESTETIAIPHGGVIYDEWTVNQAQLTSGDNAIFYLFRHDLPTRHQHLTELEIYKEYSEDLKYAIRPKID